MTRSSFDLAVIGGGINGAGIAADAAGRGLSVLLAEMGDLGGATSSASSKLIHGGLRYLEHFEFRLVREALREREVLLANAPHIIRPMRFVLPQVPGGRSRFVLRAGLFLYDHLARRRAIPGSSALDLAADPAGRALRAELAHAGFAYWDCWVDDARLVVLNARAAAEHGADIRTRTRVVALRADGDRWRLTLEADGVRSEVMARAVVNAAGPWADKVAGLVRSGEGAAKDEGRERPETARLRLVKGSHIVVPRIPGADDAYLCQSPDGRVVFALPFEESFTLIGTTDVPFGGSPGDVRISEEETDYLLGLANAFFRHPLSKDGIVWSFAGVRPLYDDETRDPSAVSRDYRIELRAVEGAPPMVNVLGGKVTTYRRLAQSVLAKLAPYLPEMGTPWTENAPLPGGDVGNRGYFGFLEDLKRRMPGFAAISLERLARRYGTRADAILGDARSERDLGADLGGGLSEKEVIYLKELEWARAPDDVLWRRTKAGLHLPADVRPLAAERIARLL
jgi:glycerol-3-phosphate dehydrogenase